MLTELEILGRLKDGHIHFPPLSLSVVEFHPLAPSDRTNRERADALIDASWGDRRYRFVVEFKAYTSPKALRETITQVTAVASAFNSRPIIVTSWLPPQQLEELERQQVSGVDLNGNGIIVVPNELLIYRSGKPNAYPRTLPIRNVYQGGSSLVPRVLLLKPVYGSVGEVHEEICSRSGRIALSTVSRVLQQLEEDLVLSREKRAIRLLQPDKLLENLASAHKPPRLTSRFVAKSSLSLEEMGKRVARFARAAEARIVFTGAASVNRYAAMAREPILSIYAEKDAAATARQIDPGAEPSKRFPNLEVFQTTDDAIFFDRRIEPDGVFASPVQTWLELTTGDKRQRDVADQVKSMIRRDVALATGGARDAE